MFNGFFRIDTIVVVQGGHFFESTRAMERIGCSNVFRSFLIFKGSGMFPRISAMRTSVDARIRCALAFAPEKRFSLNLLSAIFAGGEIQRLQMDAESLVPFLEHHKIGERSFEI